MTDLVGGVPRGRQLTVVTDRCLPAYHWLYRGNGTSKEMATYLFRIVLSSVHAKSSQASNDIKKNETNYIYLIKKRK